MTCGSCHKSTPAELVTGSHSQHLKVDNNCDYCHSGAYLDTAYDSQNHINNQIDVSSVGYNAGGAPGNGYGTCATAICHGSISPLKTWGTNTLPGTDACTKCHGTPTVGTVTAANRQVVAPSDPAATDTGKVSTTNVRTGAHQTHLLFSNGLKEKGSVDDNCSACHGSPLPTNSLHAVSLFVASQSSDPTATFSGLATNNGTMSPSPVFDSGASRSCSNTYCHNPAGVGGTLASTNAGTNISPVWTDAAYIADGTLKSDSNCNKCHKSPNGSNVISTSYNHSGLTIANSCVKCHEHDGGLGGSVGRQHIDGVKWGQAGADGCVSCHGYGAGTWVAAPAVNPGGKGAHEAHIIYLTTKRFTAPVTLSPLTDQYAGTTDAWTKVCGICHGNTASNHGSGGGNGTVNVALDQGYFFGSSGTAQYNGAPGGPVGNKSCSNLNCHYFTTPQWSN
jgi:predicted CxxxxCH...CXXCH cytochrome family protein